jgi:hypothetical protein
VRASTSWRAPTPGSPGSSAPRRRGPAEVARGGGAPASARRSWWGSDLVQEDVVEAGVERDEEQAAPELRLRDLHGHEVRIQAAVECGRNGPGRRDCSEGVDVRCGHIVDERHPVSVGAGQGLRETAAR